MGKVLLVFCVFWGFLCWFLGGGVFSCFVVGFFGFVVVGLLVWFFFFPLLHCHEFF